VAGSRRARGREGAELTALIVALGMLMLPALALTVVAWAEDE
jgi:hypothetical protein